MAVTTWVSGGRPLKKYLKPTSKMDSPVKRPRKKILGYRKMMGIFVKDKKGNFCLILIYCNVLYSILKNIVVISTLNRILAEKGDYYLKI